VPLSQQRRMMNDELRMINETYGKCAALFVFTIYH
jgi:hypothetical protein